MNEPRMASSVQAADAEEDPVNIRYTVCILLLMISFSTWFITPVEAVDEEEQIGLSNSGWSFVRLPIESRFVEVFASSYEPELAQFNELLRAFGSSGFGAVSMTSVMLELRHIPQLSSRIEIAYATDELETSPPNASDLQASFIPFSAQLLYRPVLLSELLPFYIGFGVGYSHLSVSGSALDLLEQQGIAFEEKDSGLTGFLLTGLEFSIWEDQVSVMIEAKRILKEFVANPTLNLDFDGTAIGVGIRWKL